MNKEYIEVREFHQAFNHPVADKLISLTEERAKKKICLDVRRNK